MSYLLIPVAPFSKTKSRLKDCFSKDQLKGLTIAMFKDLGDTLKEVNCFKGIIVYSNNSEILNISNDYGFIGIREELRDPPSTFDEILNDLNSIAIKKFNAEATVICFLDLILISSDNLYEINALLDDNQIVVCPAIHSAGISVLGRRPANIIHSCFSDPNTPSFISLCKVAKNMDIQKIAIYDSFRAGFDVDLKNDLLLAYEYLKIFNLTQTKVFKFLKENLKLAIQKFNVNNNRDFEIIEKFEEQ